MNTDHRESTTQHRSHMENTLRKFENRSVRWVVVDFRVLLRVEGPEDHDLEIVIEDGHGFIAGLDDTVGFVPLVELQVGQVRKMVGETIGRVHIEGAGELNIELTAGIRIIVPSNERYESWQILGDKGDLIVCMPGGELGVWGEE